MIGRVSRPTVLVGAVAVAFALACGGNGDDVPENTELDGTWVLEQDGEPRLARQIALDSYNGQHGMNEYIYQDGTPVLYRHGLAYLQGPGEVEVPGIDEFDVVLHCYYDGFGFYIAGQTYDLVDRINGNEMVLTSVVTGETTTWKRYDALP